MMVYSNVENMQKLKRQSSMKLIARRRFIRSASISLPPVTPRFENKRTPDALSLPFRVKGIKQ